MLRGGGIGKALKPEDRSLESVFECADFLLPRGVGMHHGGLLPILRETTEILFKEGLIKVIWPHCGTKEP